MRKLGGLCAMRYALVKTSGSNEWTRLDVDDAVKHQHGKCELCGREVGARLGDIRVNHWYHLDGRGDCDPWHEPKGEWHRKVQDCFPVARQEYVMRRQIDGTIVKHIADIYTKSGYVIEVQMSPLSLSKIAEREAFYERIVWLVSGHNPMTENFHTDNFMREAEFVQGDGFEYLVVPEKSHAINRHWANRPGFVFFDFDPESGVDFGQKDIVCLVPGTARHGYCVCRIIKERELIDAFLGDNAPAFIADMMRTAEDFRVRFIDETRRAEADLDRRVDKVRYSDDVDSFKEEQEEERVMAAADVVERRIGTDRKSYTIAARRWKPKVKLTAQHREKLKMARKRRRWGSSSPHRVSSVYSDYSQFTGGPVSNTAAAWRQGEKEWWEQHLAAKRARWRSGC